MRAFHLAPLGLRVSHVGLSFVPFLLVTRIQAMSFTSKQTPASHTIFTAYQFRQLQEAPWFLALTAFIRKWERWALCTLILTGTGSSCSHKYLLHVKKLRHKSGSVPANFASHCNGTGGHGNVDSNARFDGAGAVAQAVRSLP